MKIMKNEGEVEADMTFLDSKSVGVEEAVKFKRSHLKLP